MQDLPDIEGVWVSDREFAGAVEGPFAGMAHPLRLTIRSADPTQIAGRWTWGSAAHGKVTGVALREGLQLFLAGATHGGEVTLRLRFGQAPGTPLTGVVNGTVGSIRTYPQEPPYIVFSEAEVGFRRGTD